MTDTRADADMGTNIQDSLQADTDSDPYSRHTGTMEGWGEKSRECESGLRLGELTPGGSALIAFLNVRLTQDRCL